MDNHAGHRGGLKALSELDPAQNLEVDISNLRAKIAAKMATQGLVFDATAAAKPTATAHLVSDGCDNVISLRERQGSPRHHWFWGLSAAAAVAAVGLTGWATLNPLTAQAPHPSDSETPAKSLAPRLAASGVSPAIPGATERLSEVGKVDFVATGDFSVAPTKAPAYRLSEGAAVSSGKVQKVADTLGIKGAVKKNNSGFTVKDTSGATLTVTVGELTSLDFSNPAALHMVCVPVTPGDGNVELPNPNRSETGAPPVRPTVPPTVHPTAPNPAVPQQNPGTEAPRFELPKVKPSSPRPQVTPLETPTETVPPAVRPGAVKPSGADTPPPTAPKETETEAPSETQAYHDYPTGLPQGEMLELGEVQAHHERHVPDSDAPAKEPAPHEPARETSNPANTDQAEAQVTQSPSPNPSNCVMRVAGEAPSAAQALAEVSKVANSLGATVMSTQAGASQKDGLTAVDVPVKMPGQNQTQTWRAVVSANGLVSVRANLGKETKLGYYQVISEKQAVERLNDPQFGPIDVFDPTGKTKGKISGKIELVEAKLANAPVKQQDGSMVSMPVYHLADTLGRIWTVLAVTDAK